MSRSKKVLVLILIVFTAIVGFVLKLFIGACDEKIISREVSPDRKVEFVVIRKNCGATTPFVTNVYLTAPGEKIEFMSEPVFKVTRDYKMDISWEKDRHLLISYEDAKIWSYKNFWYSKAVDDYEYKVYIEEARKSRDLKNSDIYNNR